jgi:hypothetical protein
MATSIAARTHDERFLVRITPPDHRNGETGDRDTKMLVRQRVGRFATTP